VTRRSLNDRRRTTSPCNTAARIHRFPCGPDALALSSLPFASCYAYSPRGEGWFARASRQICERVKTIDPQWLPRYAGVVYQASLCDPQLATLFARGAVLVPVPGSTATGEASWAALQLAIALSQVGFALPVWVGLRRRFTVRKSARAPCALRPSVAQHYDSFSVVPLTSPVRRVVLVDDVVTKGRTLLAAAARLRAEIPCADIRAFALLRTRGFVERLEQLSCSCHGVIRWSGGDARREP
jgi:hypothetical protein